MTKGPAGNNPTVLTPETPAVADSKILDIDVQEVSASTRREWDILKSIVHGGLIESITSLSVVSSAAGAGSSTCEYQSISLSFFFNMHAYVHVPMPISVYIIYV